MWLFRPHHPVRVHFRFLIYATVLLTLGATYCQRRRIRTDTNEEMKKSPPRLIENNNNNDDTDESGCNNDDCAPKCETKMGTNTNYQLKNTKYTHKGPFAENRNLSNAAEEMPSMQPIETQWDRILNCFSLTDNFRTLWRSQPISTSSPSLTFIPIIDGIRYVVRPSFLILQRDIVARRVNAMRRNWRGISCHTPTPTHRLYSASLVHYT